MMIVPGAEVGAGAEPLLVEGTGATIGWASVTAQTRGVKREVRAGPVARIRKQYWVAGSRPVISNAVSDGAGPGVTLDQPVKMRRWMVHAVIS